MVGLVLEVHGAEIRHEPLEKRCIARPDSEDDHRADISNDCVSHFMINLGQVLVGKD